MAIEEEDGITNDSNVFASLMPNLYSRLQHCNDTVSEQEFQEIHRLLDLARSDNNLSEGNLSMDHENRSMNQPLLPSSKQEEKVDELAHEEVTKKPSPLIKSVYAIGKENAVPTKLPQRNKPSRRERSTRVITHRKPFVVDIRNFGSIRNNNVSGKYKRPQDVHAFWEAADEREASEAIMSKLSGKNGLNSGMEDTALRRVRLRRKNSQRTTTRLKCFSVELPACAEQVQSLDEVQLEEEEDAMEESSFTFLSNPEFRAQNHLFELSNVEKRTKPLQLLSSVQLSEEDMEIVDLQGAAELNGYEEDDNGILSDGKSPLENSKVAISEDGTDECEKKSQVPAILSDASSHQGDSRNKDLAKDIGTTNELEMKGTPYNRNAAAKRTPFTSPTPPSNPLADFGLKRDTIVEDISKRRLNFDVNNLSSTTLELDSLAPMAPISPILQNHSASPEDPQAQVEVSSPADVTVACEENLELAEDDSTKGPNVVPAKSTKSTEQNAIEPLKKATAKRKKLMNNRKHSLAGAGTKWNEGQRRSTRIRSRPLEWWRGERFLVGRVHKSLATVIGIKYSSPPPCWPKRGTKAPEFKVQSYVSEEYAKYVRFAALC